MPRDLPVIKFEDLDAIIPERQNQSPEERDEMIVNVATHLDEIAAEYIGGTIEELQEIIGTMRIEPHDVFLTNIFNELENFKDFEEHLGLHSTPIAERAEATQTVDLDDSDMYLRHEYDATPQVSPIHTEAPNFKFKGQRVQQKTEKAQILWRELQRRGNISNKFLHFHGERFAIDPAKLLKRAIADTHRNVKDVKNVPAGWDVLMYIAQMKPHLIQYMGEYVKTQVLKDDFLEWNRQQNVSRGVAPKATSEEDYEDFVRQHDERLKLRRRYIMDNMGSNNPAMKLINKKIEQDEKHPFYARYLKEMPQRRRSQEQIIDPRKEERPVQSVRMFSPLMPQGKFGVIPSPRTIRRDAGIPEPIPGARRKIRFDEPILRSQPTQQQRMQLQQRPIVRVNRIPPKHKPARPAPKWESLYESPSEDDDPAEDPSWNPKRKKSKKRRFGRFGELE